MLKHRSRAQALAVRIPKSKLQRADRQAWGASWFLSKLDTDHDSGRAERVRLPAGWQGNALAWDLAFHLVQLLNLLQTPDKSRRLDRRLQRFQDLDSVPLGVVRRVIDTLICQGLDAAYEAFSAHQDFREVSMQFPEIERASVTDRRGREKRIYHFPGRVITTGYPHLPASLCLWTVLLDERIALRARRCPICLFYFLDLTKNRSQRHCSSRCTSVDTSRDYRAAGKERAARSVRRVTGQPGGSHPN